MARGLLLEGVSSPRRDWVRLATALPILLLAFYGRQQLGIDVENLSMKSRGTETDQAVQQRDAEFGTDPQIFLYAQPRAPELLHHLDTDAADAWVDLLGRQLQIQQLEQLPAPHTGGHCLLATLRVDAEGRYAEKVERFTKFAREALPATYRLAVAGGPIVEVAIARELGAERQKILPIIAIGLFFVLFLIYRDLILVLGALLAPLLGTFLLEGLQGLLGFSIDPVTGLLGPAVLTVGVASSVHVLERYRQNLAAGHSTTAASRRAALQLRLPMLLTVLTTVAGFLGLLTNPIPAITQFALLASAGVVITVLCTLTYLPSLLRLFHRGQNSQRHQPRRAALFHGASLQRWSRPIALAALALLVISSWLMTKNHVDSNPMQILASDNLVRRDSQAISEQLGGTEVFELLLPPRDSGGAWDVLQLVTSIAALDGVVSPSGFPRQSANQFLLLSFLLRPGGSAERALCFDQAEQLAREAGWAGAKATGLAVQVARDSNQLVHGQRRGAGWTLLALWAVMSLGFQSLWLGFLGLLPNILPITLIQASFAALDRPLSVAASMIGAAMLGLVVDDTIHLLHAYKHARGDGLRRTARTLERVRRPITITTLVLCVGFAATAFGELQATREFGILAVSTLLIAWIADLALLPVLLMRRSASQLRES